MFRRFHPYAQYMANFRDHALLLYAQRGQTLDFDARRFPELPALAARRDDAAAGLASARAVEEPALLNDSA
jgi:hypothetical protein